MGARPALAQFLTSFHRDAEVSGFRAPLCMLVCVYRRNSFQRDSCFQQHLLWILVERRQRIAHYQPPAPSFLESLHYDSLRVRIFLGWFPIAMVNGVDEAVYGRGGLFAT